jgi:hypothetical protein
LLIFINDWSPTAYEWHGLLSHIILMRSYASLLLLSLLLVIMMMIIIKLFWDIQAHQSTRLIKNVCRKAIVSLCHHREQYWLEISEINVFDSPAGYRLHWNYVIIFDVHCSSRFTFYWLRVECHRPVLINELTHHNCHFSSPLATCVSRRTYISFAYLFMMCACVCLFRSHRCRLTAWYSHYSWAQLIEYMMIQLSVDLFPFAFSFG